jgi:hypothetical protein
MKQRGNGPDLDLERLGDRGVVEVEVMAKEDGVPLPLRESQDGRADGRVGFVGYLDGRVGGFREGILEECGTSRVPRRIEDAAANPGLESPEAAEGVTAADGARESLLERVARTLWIAGPRQGEAEEISTAFDVDSLDRID